MEKIKKEYKYIGRCFMAIFGMALILFICWIIFTNGDGGFFNGKDVNMSSSFSDKATGEKLKLPCETVTYKEGEGSSIVAILPDNLEGQMYLRIHVLYQDVTVKIDGVVREEYLLKDRKKFGSTQVPLLLLVELDHFDSGKELEIIYSSEVNYYKGFVGDVYLGTFSEIMRSQIAQNGFSMMLAFIIEVLSIFIIMGTFVLSKRLETGKSLLYLGCVGLLAALWIICDATLRQLFLHESTACLYLKIFALAMVPVPMALYINDLQNNRYRLIYSILSAIDIVTYVVVTVLQVGEIALYRDTLPFVHGNLLIMSVFLVATIVIDINQKKGTYLGISAQVGILAITTATIVEIMFTWVNPANAKGGIVGIGALIFFICFAYMTISNQIKEWNDRNENLAEEKSKSAKIAEKFGETQQDIIISLATVIENRDEVTGDHVLNTRKYVEYIIKCLRQNNKYLDVLTDEYARLTIDSAPLHDVGKIFTPEAILNKPGKLTAEEFDEIKKHTMNGGRIIENIVGGLRSHEYLDMAKQVAMYHHERWDGKGYPLGLRENGIPLCARIMALADVTDALLSRRQYKPAFTLENTYEILSQEAGKQFDPIILSVFLEHWDEFCEIYQR